MKMFPTNIFRTVRPLCGSPFGASKQKIEKFDFLGIQFFFLKKKCSQNVEALSPTDVLKFEDGAELARSRLVLNKTDKSMKENMSHASKVKQILRGDFRQRDFL